MIIYTGYFEKLLKYLGDDLFPISVCGKAPDDYHGVQYKRLAPKKWFFDKYARGEFSEEDYTKFYKKEVLEPLNIQEVYARLMQLSGGVNVVLLCYEQYGYDFCHRHLVSKWFREYGFKSQEFLAYF